MLLKQLFKLAVQAVCGEPVSPPLPCLTGKKQGKSGERAGTERAQGQQFRGLRPILGR